MDTPFSMNDNDRDSLDFDVVIVGAGPAGLSTAIRLKQLAQDAGNDLSICLLEKGSEVGAHIVSGAVFEPRALDELIPDWKMLGAPIETPVTQDDILFLPNAKAAIHVPKWLTPKTLHNSGNYIISLGLLCRWLAEQAEALGVEIFPGFAAQRALIEDHRVVGVVTGDMGVDRQGRAKSGHAPGMIIRGKTTVFAEGAHGHIGQQLSQQFQLGEGKDPQHYGLGIKERWRVVQANPGQVVHATGWPLREHGATGGLFLYHLSADEVVVGLITDLNYRNPHLSPFDEFQRLKHHPAIASILAGGERLGYGARAIAKGGIQSLPKMSFPGGLLIGCNAGTLNFAKIKGSHTAMKSGMVAAEVIWEAARSGWPDSYTTLPFDAAFQDSWAWQELYQQRNFGPAMHRFGNLLGAAYAVIEQNVLQGKVPWTWRDPEPDHAALKRIDEQPKIVYAKPDHTLSFDRNSSVHLSNTYHEADQPVHLKLIDASLPITRHWEDYLEPAQRYCPAGVYEVLEQPDGLQFQINAQNCIHCKTCHIKDPSQNIQWIAPEGGGGPNYTQM